MCALLALSGCGPTCKRDPGDPPVVYEDGKTSPSKLHYMTGSFEDRFLRFPGGRTYRLEHQLGRSPARLTTYVSFSECPLQEGDDCSCSSCGGGFSESAGNQAIIEDVNDEFILVRNDTCAEFYLRIEATSGDYDLESAPDAGAD
jgi:hypothetical protein